MTMHRTLILIIAGLALAAVGLVVLSAPAGTVPSDSLPPAPHPARQPTASPDTASSDQPNASIHRHYELIMSADQVEPFLSRWNEKMSWGFTPQQVADYSSAMTEGILVKYRSPNGLAIEVEDIPAFSRDISNSLGLSPEQTELFVQEANRYYRDGMLASYELHPTVPVTQESSDGG